MKKSSFTHSLSAIALISASCLILPAILPAPLLAQQVSNVSPGLNSDDVPADASISGVFRKKDGVGVDLNSVRIYVNDQDVTNRSTITANFFSYRPDRPLSPGTNQVKVAYKDEKGKDRTVIWTFDVQQPQAKVEITSVTHNAESKALGPGSTFLATIKGTPNANTRVLLVENGKGVRQLPVQEVSPGVYVATLNVTANDNISEGIVVARLQRQNQTIFRAASQPLVLSKQASSGEIPPTQPNNPNQPEKPTRPNNGQSNNRPLRPLFTSHQNGNRINTRGFILTGQTQPNAQVKVKVTASLSILGGFVNLSNSTLVDETITADSQGNFQVDVPPPPTLAPGTQYTIQAVAKNKDETSQAVQFGLVQE
jgi:hypothetical protein